MMRSQQMITGALLRKESVETEQAMLRFIRLMGLARQEQEQQWKTNSMTMLVTDLQDPRLK